MCRLQDSEIYRLLVSQRHFDPKLHVAILFTLLDAYTVRAPSPVRMANKGAHKQFSPDFAPTAMLGTSMMRRIASAELETKTRLDPSDFRRVNDFS